MGSWCYCFKFLGGIRLHWLSFGEILKVKSYKEFKFLVFDIFKWVFRFVFVWGTFKKVNISRVKFESYTHPSIHQFDTIMVQSCHKLSEAGLMFWFRDCKQITLVTLKVGLSPPKKIPFFASILFISFKSDKNAFYFIFKALFVLKILKFLSWLFGRVEKLAWLER